MIRIIIADDNENLCINLSQLLANEKNIEIINVPMNKFEELNSYINVKTNLFILDSKMSIIVCTELLKQLNMNADNIKKNFIILVTNLKVLDSIYNNQILSKSLNEISGLNLLVNTIQKIQNSVINDNALEKNINDLLWKLGFTPYYKGTQYLKDAIFLAYKDNILLEKVKILIEEIAKSNNINNFESVRSLIDKSLNSMLTYTDPQKITDIFSDYYDGRKISFRYFIWLCINTLSNKLENDELVTLFSFV